MLGCCVLSPQVTLVWSLELFLLWYLAVSSKALDIPRHFRNKRDITFPGTKWCGPGSRAQNFTDLGDEKEVDRCCRAHDHCPDSIPGYRWKHGLHNPTPYTRSHCYCDDAFRHCLVNASSKIGNLVAEIYFNFLKIKCYKEDCPIIRCLKYSGSRPQRVCQEYKMDCNQPRLWQFFDPRKWGGLNEKERNSTQNKDNVPETKDQEGKELKQRGSETKQQKTKQGIAGLFDSFLKMSARAFMVVAKSTNG